mmetsp:Transcript_13600/g.44984  ORF Transcript_13600/g.44984 Transcript_13600/m.44984 type:complete len:406 (+) Transcript_13600:1078-2295(+)
MQRSTAFSEAVHSHTVSTNVFADVSVVSSSASSSTSSSNSSLFRLGQPSSTVFGSKPPNPNPWIANGMPCLYVGDTMTCANPRTFAAASFFSNVSRASATRRDNPRSRDSTPSSISATTHSPRPFLSCDAKHNKASWLVRPFFRKGGTTWMSSYSSRSPPFAENTGLEAASFVPTPPTTPGQLGRHKSCGRQFDECFLSCAKSSIAAVARSSRIPPSALPQSTRTCADSMYATNAASMATATRAKYQRMINASVVHSRKPNRPTDQWKYLQVGRQEGAFVRPRAKVLKFSALYAARKQIDRRGATKSSEPIMDAHTQNVTVAASAATGSPRLSTNAAFVRNGTVPSTAMAFNTPGALIKHCNACDRDAIMIPICVGNANGHAISETTPMLSPALPASNRRRFDSA